ncbi:uncharacterized protein FOMMEDRAFT_154493 [Fomitiporia mediterranea MF3/22]|uniref:uncharacterized protein n=1 Tax=Fomitiporia mediterranea (strain MF3/22) TaxID=694068 RepID=UPI0004408F98|nr:uncharacterized protein FOMMEDRAFT_154493 [Fomitiporia mediterranea MF3/22]EJD05265.1 hypothetical protein FOMMEDRAFT_154493 [Fomitiporia mediterranea MF3/22]
MSVMSPSTSAANRERTLRALRVLDDLMRDSQISSPREPMMLTSNQPNRDS